MDILFIDAECPLCNRAALFLARRTRAEEIQFASLTGRTAREMGLRGAMGLRGEANLGSEADLGESQLESSSVALMHGQQLFFRTEAVIMALSRAHGFRFLRRWMWLPWRWLDPIYRLVAANRHRIQWEGSVCSVEMPERMLP
jgi:predicted DCC family thiol-disulfide oxidoreductase YuxK